MFRNSCRDTIMFPVVLNLTGRTVLVVGAGEVGRRRTMRLLEVGASVRLVDPQPWTDPSDHPQIDRIVAPYSRSHLTSVSLAFACASNEVNATVVADAQEAGIWVGDADEPSRGDLIIPSVLRRGGLTLSVSTGGASPTLAKRIVHDLAEQFDSTYAGWVRLLGEMRKTAMNDISDPIVRRKILAKFTESHWLLRIQSVGAEQTLIEMKARMASELK